MTSGKQRKAEIKARRLLRAAAKIKRCSVQPPSGTAPCNPDDLAPSNSYGVPEFVARGYYVDVLFQCAVCLKQEVWSAARQKWWYEVAKGSVESRAKLCNSCRRADRERKAQARLVYFAGLAAKFRRRNPP